MTSRTKLGLAFTTVCLAWGASYFAIRIGLQSMPPLIMGFIRYVIAGVLIWLWCEFRGEERPTGRQWVYSGLLGFCFVVLGNGTVLWVEQTVPSGATALLVAISPIWTMLFEWAFKTRGRPSAASWLGLALGFAGVALLVAGTGGGSVPLLQAGVLVIGTLGWALGSNLSLRFERPKSPLRAISAQMIVGGVALLVMGLARGEAHAGAWGHIDLAGLMALSYLIFIASIAAYIAYGWLIHNVSPTAAGVCAYVNPAVAVLLGAAYGEPLHWRQFAALGTILAGVAILSTGEYRRKGPKAEAGNASTVVEKVVAEKTTTFRSLEGAG